MYGFPRLTLFLAISSAAITSLAQQQSFTHPSLTKKLEGEELFWQSEPIKLPKLKAASPKLIGKPNTAIDFAVVEVDQREPTNFLDNSKSEIMAPYLDKTGETYALVKEGLSVGSKVYGDRKYLIKTLPEELKGLTLLQTRSAHKAIVDARYAIVLETKTPIWVFVALDERGLLTYESLGTPGWLKEYSPTGLKVLTDDPRMEGWSGGYHIVARKAGPGKIVLGAPGVEVSYNSMYFAFFAEAE